MICCLLQLQEVFLNPGSSVHLIGFTDCALYNRLLDYTFAIFKIFPKYFKYILNIFCINAKLFKSKYTRIIYTSSQEEDYRWVMRMSLTGGILGIRMLECRGAYNQINQSKTYIWLKLNNNNAAKILQSAKINQSILLGHLKSINNLCNPANNMFMLW